MATFRNIWSPSVITSVSCWLMFFACMRGSRNFRQGGGGGPGQSDKKKSSDNVFFFFFFFLVLSLFYRSQMVNFKEIYHFSRFQRGATFSRGGGGGSNFFQGGSNSLLPIETHITCDFPGGGGGGGGGGESGPPVPPLWIRTCFESTIPPIIC